MKARIIVSILLCCSCLGWSQTWQWGVAGGGPDYDQFVSIAEDGSGNTYALGKTLGPFVQFGPLLYNYQSSFSWSNRMFVVKFDALANPVWLKGFDNVESIAPPLDDFPGSIVCDTAGNIYISGVFRSDSLPFGDTTLFNPANDSRLFIAKLDPSGKCSWAKMGDGLDVNKCILKTDVFGSLFLSGNVSMTGCLTLSGDTLMVNSSGNAELFLSKLDLDGNMIWSRNEKNHALMYALCSDVSQNIIVAGEYYGNMAVFGSDTLQKSWPHDVFLVKYNSAGNVVWARSVTGELGSWEIPGAVCADGNGDIYLGGSFDGDSLFFHKQLALTNVNVAPVNYDLFIMRLTATGNLKWARSFQSDDEDLLKDILIHPNGRVICTGSFRGDSLIMGSFFLARSSVMTTGYFAELDGSGNPLVAYGGGSEGMGLAIDSLGNIIWGGMMENDTLQLGNLSIISLNSGNCFLAKVDDATGVDHILSDSPIIEVSPNPVYDQLRIGLNEPITGISVYDSFGRKIQVSMQNGFLNVDSWAAGIYFLQISTSSGNYAAKVIKR